MSGLARRLTACVLFFPLFVPFAIVAPLTVLTAGLGWLWLGWHGGRLDAVFLNPVLLWSAELPLKLFKT